MRHPTRENRLLGPPLSPSRRSQYSERTVLSASGGGCVRIFDLPGKKKKGCRGDDSPWDAASQGVWGTGVQRLLK
jgi:hypothetical protein